MTQVQLQQLQKQLWNIANTLRGTMGADEFRDYILGFIFFKYLSEKSVNFANELLDGEDVAFLELDENNPEHVPYIEEIKKNAVLHLTNPVRWTSEESVLNDLIKASGDEWELIEPGVGAVLTGLWGKSGFSETAPCKAVNSVETL